MKLRRSHSDESLYIDEDLIIVIYVDDLLILSSNLDIIKRAKAHLMTRYEMKNADEATKFLEINIHRDRANRRMRLKQSSYAKRIVRD